MKPQNSRPKGDRLATIGDYLNQQNPICSTGIKPEPVTQKQIIASTTYKPTLPIIEQYNPNPSFDNIGKSFSNPIKSTSTKPFPSFHQTIKSTAYSPQNIFQGMKSSLEDKLTQPTKFEPIISTPYKPFEIKPLIDNSKPITQFEPIKPIYKQPKFLQPKYQPIPKFKPIEYKIPKFNFPKFKPIEFKQPEFKPAVTSFNTDLEYRKKYLASIMRFKPYQIPEMEPTFNEAPVYNYIKNKIKLPKHNPQTFRFIRMDDKGSQELIKNSYLPHEMGHAKICTTFPKNKEPTFNNRGFHEHAADSMANNSLKNTLYYKPYISSEMKYQNQWASNPKYFPQMEQDYTNNLKKESEIPSLVGHQASVNMWGNHPIKKKQQDTLNKSLYANFGNDEEYNTRIFNGMDSLSKTYQEEAKKLFTIATSNTLFPEKKAESIWDNVGKKTKEFRRLL